MEDRGCHVCEGDTSKCSESNVSCCCKEIAAMRRARSNILCTDGEYCQKARKNFLKSFIQHGIKDDCKKGLSIAMEEVLETKRDNAFACIKQV